MLGSTLTVLSVGTMLLLEPLIPLDLLDPASFSELDLDPIESCCPDMADIFEFLRAYS